MSQEAGSSAASRRLELPAFAKINLVLDLLGPLPGGYTEIATIFQSVELADRVGLEWGGPPGRVELSLSGLAIEGDPESNLAVRAARSWRAVAAVETGIRIRLHKRIPPCAGLGGGSADAAAVLLGLNRLAGGRLPERELVHLGGRLGADVPFLLGGGLALGRGRGDRIEELADLPPLHVVLARVGEGLSTARVFAAARERLTGEAKAPNIQRFLEYLRGGAGGLPPVENDLLDAAVGLDEDLRRLLGRFGREGVRPMMTGSGSAVFALFADARRAVRVAERIAEMEEGIWVVVTRTLGRRAVEQMRERWQPEGEE